MGTMLKKENKNIMKWKIVLSIATVVLFILFDTNVINAYPAYWHEQAGRIPNIIGGIFFAGAIGFPVVFSSWITDKAKDETAWYVVWVIVIVAACLTSAGFKFDFPK